MNERHAKLLLGLINHYIDTAKPVSSSIALGAAGLDLSPATARTMLHQLDESGYLFQPHTSAGRVPTDKGYRFYVDHLKAEKRAVDKENKTMQLYQRSLEKNNRTTVAIASILADLAQAYVVAGNAKTGELDQSGASYVANQGGEGQVEAMREVSRFVDHAREYIVKLASQDHNLATAYIGQENPVIDAEHTSLLVRTVTQSDGQQTVVIIVGPKRMPYQRNLNFLNELINII